MKRRIDKLTPEQEAMLPVWRDKWIDIGLKTGETDWETFGAYMPVCYQKAGLKYPDRIVQVSSPLVGAFASSIASNILKTGGSKMTAVESAVGSSVGSSVRSAVESAVESAVGSSVRSAVESAVESAVGSSVRSAVRSAVGSSVGSSVGSAVESAVGSSVGSAVESARLEWHYWLGGQFWVGGWWYGSPSMVSFFTDVCKLQLTKDIQERATAYRKISESVNYIWCNSDFIMVCARPTKIERNSQGQLHSEKGKSIEYPDTWGLYFLNGVRFEEEMYWKVVKTQSEGGLSFSERLAIPDIDQRTQALNPKFCDINAFLKQVKAELVDEVNKFDIKGNPVNYKLYKIPQGEIFSQDAYYCYFDCPSTGKKHLEGVEVSSTVAECMAWAMSNEMVTVTPSQWQSMVPLVDEN